MLLVETAGITEPRAVQIGFAAAYIANLVLLRNFVYRSTRGWRRDVVRYVFVNGAFRVGEYFVFLALYDNFGAPYPIALLTVLALSAFLKFFAYRALFAARRPQSRTK